MLRRFCSDRGGATKMEYAMIILILAIAVYFMYHLKFDRPPSPAAPAPAQVEQSHDSRVL